MLQFVPAISNMQDSERLLYITEGRKSTSCIIIDLINDAEEEKEKKFGANEIGLA